MISPRFRRLAQLLFTSEISEDDKATARRAVDMLDRAATGLGNWLETIESNLEHFNNYHGQDSALADIAPTYEEAIEKQKTRYEEVIALLKKAVDVLAKVQDVELEEIIGSLTQESQKFTELYNELTGLPVPIGSAGFIQKFKDTSKLIVDNNDPFFDIIERAEKYIKKNILGEQSLS